MPEVRWLTGFLDVAAAAWDPAIAFWTAATGTSLSSVRGEAGQFATLVPPVGDACWRMQRVGAADPGLHLDLHGDPVLLERDVTERGAYMVSRDEDVTVLRSPGGFAFCIVPDAGTPTGRPSPVDHGGYSSLMDQVCLDVPGALVGLETAFWAGVLGVEPAPSTRRAEFTNLPRPDRLGLRLLVQRIGKAGRVAAHPDLATTDRVAEVARLESLGAQTTQVEEFWTVLRAPDGRLFCVTERDPATGESN